MDRSVAGVAWSASDAPDGLRDFTYSLSDTAFVHHIFTRNHSDVQEEPTRLFHDIQAHVEVPSASAARTGAIRSHNVYSVDYLSSRSAGKSPGKAQRRWPSTHPECVSRARTLMLRRSRLGTRAADLTINALTITAWRRAGNKKVSMHSVWQHSVCGWISLITDWNICFVWQGQTLAAKDAPVVVLVLGADLELSFSRVAPSGHPSPPLSAAAAPQRVYGPPPAPADDDGDEDGREGDGSPADEDAPNAPLPTGPTTKKQKTSKGKDDEALMVTLVHGDMLVVEGAVFEVC